MSDDCLSGTDTFGDHRPGCCPSDFQHMGYIDVVDNFAVGGNDSLPVSVTNGVITARGILILNDVNTVKQIGVSFCVRR